MLNIKKFKYLATIAMVSPALSTLYAQERVYEAPQVTIFSSPEQVFELPGSGEYIGPERLKKYNFGGINEVLREVPGVYSREETGKGIIANISIRGTATLRSTQVNLLEDGINIAPAPYSAPDAYYTPITRKMNALEVLKGSSQYRYGPHNTAGAVNFVTTPVTLGEKYFGSVSYGSGHDIITHDYINYGLTGNFGAVAILGELYYRNGGGQREFNIDPPSSSVHRKNYGSDELGDMNMFAPMVKLLWQLPTERNIILEVKYAYEDNNYNQSYAGQSTADFNANPHHQYVAHQLGEYNTEHHTSYIKLRADVNSNISNTSTAYFNYFTRDWFKLDSIIVTGTTTISEQVFNSRMATGDQLTARNVAKGLTAGQLVYKGNDRQYGAYGFMNETDFDFDTSFLGDASHQLKVGYKYHYDYHHRDQQKHNFSQAVGGLITAHSSGVTFSDDRKETTKGHAVYFEDTAKFDRLELSLGARLEHFKMHYRDKAGAGTSNMEEEMTMWAPGGGLLYNHNENWQSFFGAYKGFNIPSPSTARDDGTPIEKETSLAKEIGVRYSDDTLNVTAVAFRTFFEDLIVINNTNNDSTPDNAGNVITKGLELTGRYDPVGIVPVGDISFFANYAFTNANLASDSNASDSKASLFAGGLKGANVPYIPEHRFSIGADYELDAFDFGVNLTYQSETYGTAAETETEEFAGSPNARAGKIDSYALVNVYGGYKINDNYKIRAGVNNAFDNEYIATRHPAGARAGAPLTAYVLMTAEF